MIPPLRSEVCDGSNPALAVCFAASHPACEVEAGVQVQVADDGARYLGIEGLELRGWGTRIL